MEMMEYVEQLAKYYDAWPDVQIGTSSVTVPQIGKLLRNVHYYDCRGVSEYTYEASLAEYGADFSIPPSIDTILPAPAIGLFVDVKTKVSHKGQLEPDSVMENTQDNLILLMPMTKKVNGDIVMETAAVKNNKPVVGYVEHDDEEEVEYPELFYKNFVALSCWLSPNTMPHPIGAIECFQAACPQDDCDCKIDVFKFSHDLETFKNQTQEARDADSTWLRHVASFLKVINKPRFVKTTPTGNRQRRRGLNRGMGFAVDAWHRVSWNVDKPVNAKQPFDKTFHKMPLHFNKGHWKKAEQHHPKSVLREGQWRTWIEGYWAGHPAFGFKKQYWTPTKKIA